MSIDNNKIEVGSLLISEPFMDDPNFQRSVILLCEHGEEGSLGFVLNKEVEELTLKDVISDVGDCSFPLYLGGPVENNLLQFIHAVGNQIDHSIRIAEGVYWGGDFEQLKFLLREGLVNEEQVKFFFGYSGWSPEQLDLEVKEKAWMTAEVDASGVFGQSALLWKKTLYEMGGKYRIISNYPIDPRLN